MTTAKKDYFIPVMYDSEYWQRQVFIIDRPEKEGMKVMGISLCHIRLDICPREEDDQVDALNVMGRKDRIWGH